MTDEVQSLSVDQLLWWSSGKTGEHSGFSHGVPRALQCSVGPGPPWSYFMINYQA